VVCKFIAINSSGSRGACTGGWAQPRGARPSTSGILGRMDVLTVAQWHFLAAQRVAHLATADANGVPHVVPVCFALADARCYIAIDEKPKRAGALALKRARNILARPEVSLVADQYDEEWSRLGYVLLHGRAEVLEGGPEHAKAVELLRGRYVQYRSMGLDTRPIIAITPHRAVSWGSLAV